MRRAEIERVRRKRPDSLDAYELVLKAQPDVDSGMPAQVTRALEYLERSLALLPTYVTANWNSSGEKWVVPDGFSVGCLIKVGKLPIKVQLGFYDNVIAPKYGSRWQSRFQVYFLL